MAAEPDEFETVEPTFRPERPAGGPGETADATTLPPIDPSSSQPGSTGRPFVPGYEVGGELGRGGMGVVYQAVQTGLRRTVALKMILSGGHASPNELVRFRAEATAIAGLQHPNIVQVYDIGEHGGLPFFSLEFCGGGSLAGRLCDGPMEADRAAEIVGTLARAVAAAHRAGVVHRDLKPANVLFTADGTPKITDFGLAKTMGDAGLTVSGAVMGTPSYMSPEQARGEVRSIGPATDVYALGAILYECLAGRPPFKGESAYSTIALVVSAEPEPPSRVRGPIPRDVETICLKCLQKDPANRYAGATELADDLDRFRRGEPVHARPLSSPARVVRWVSRNRTLSTAAVCVVAQWLLYLLWSNLPDRFKDIPFTLGFVVLILTEAWVAWFVLRPTRTRTRLLRVGLVLTVLFTSVLVGEQMDTVIDELISTWDKQTKRIVKDVLYTPKMGLALGLLCLAVSGVVRLLMGGSWKPAVAGAIIGFWIPGFVLAAGLVALGAGPRNWPGLVYAAVLSGMAVGSAIGAGWGLRHAKPPNSMR